MADGKDHEVGSPCCEGERVNILIAAITWLLVGNHDRYPKC